MSDAINPTADVYTPGTKTLEERVAQLENLISQVANSLSLIQMSVNRVIEWEEKSTASGIQLVGGNTTVKKRGILISMNTHIISPNNVTVISLAIDESGQVVIVPGPFQLV